MRVSEQSVMVLWVEGCDVLGFELLQIQRAAAVLYFVVILSFGIWFLLRSAHPAVSIILIGMLPLKGTDDEVRAEFRQKHAIT